MRKGRFARMEKEKGILLETGTNELEMIEFTICGNKFGINVIKVKEIINPIKVTTIPHSHQNIEGIIELRGEVLPVIDVSKALGFSRSDMPSLEKFIVTEFNKQKVIFHVHSVSQIHRISWEQIEKPSELYQGLDSHITGVIHKNDDMILLLDFEKIIVDINPNAGISLNKLGNLGQRERTEKKLLIAEDSALLRKLLSNTLVEAGYSNNEFFENGKDALHFLESLISEGKTVENEIQLVITDIEMPQMDGHYFTKKLKENPKLSKIPVIIFSSLITADLLHKGEMVGADGQVSKPEIGELVQLIDKFIL